MLLEARKEKLYHFRLFKNGNNVGALSFNSGAIHGVFEDTNWDFLPEGSAQYRVLRSNESVGFLRKEKITVLAPAFRLFFEEKEYVWEPNFWLSKYTLIQAGEKQMTITRDWFTGTLKTSTNKP